jgi:hypothetical protein
LPLVVKAEADPPGADAQAPLHRVELTYVATAGSGDKAIEAIEDAALDRGSSRFRSRRAGGVI